MSIRYERNGGEGRCIEGCGWRTRKRETTWKTWAWMGEITEKDLEETGWESVNWICLVRYRQVIDRLQ
jgi:hypothetical protein